VVTKDAVNVYFSDYFDIPHEEVEEYGAFDVSLINDLPLFIDPFLLFNSSRSEYRRLHDSIIAYLQFLRDASIDAKVSEGLLHAWFMFPEVKQNWLGFSLVGNKGSGLGRGFARALNRNLNRIFANFGEEQITRGSHLEKLCLIGSGVGRDHISDFTTNLIKEYLLEYTQRFARNHLRRRQREIVRVEKVKFNNGTQTWEPGEFELPYVFNDFVLLTPMDMLTKDEIWINRGDMLKDYRRVVYSVSNEQLRAQLNSYLFRTLASLPKKATKKERDAAIMKAYREYPELLDYYIRFKEDHGNDAVDVSERLVAESKHFYVDQINRFVEELNRLTSFYRLTGDTYREARERVLFLKDVIENKGGHRIFYDSKWKPVRKESDLHILYRLTWFATPSDVSREANDGRGPVDFKVSKGAYDKTLVEFKLASNPQLERNLQNQVIIYQKASDAPKAIKVIFYFSRRELNRVNQILKKLNMSGSEDIVLIDARKDNKPSASKARAADMGAIDNPDWNLEDLSFDFDDIEMNFDSDNLDTGGRIDK
jgi:hypothetical protein